MCLAMGLHATLCYVCLGEEEDDVSNEYTPILMPACVFVFTIQM
jgi:hypothetical protein